MSWSNAASVWCVQGQTRRETDSFAPVSSEVLLYPGRLFLNAALITANSAVALKQAHIPPKCILSLASPGKGSFLFFLSFFNAFV